MTLSPVALKQIEVLGFNLTKRDDKLYCPMNKDHGLMLVTERTDCFYCDSCPIYYRLVWVTEDYPLGAEQNGKSQIR